MTDPEIRDTLRQALRDWDAASDEQRAAALETSDRLAASAAPRVTRYRITFGLKQPASFGGRLVEVGRTAISADAPDSAIFAAIDRDGSRFEPWDTATCEAIR